MRFHRLFCVAVAVSFVVELWFLLPSSWLQLIACTGKAKIFNEPFLFTFQWNERLSVFFDEQCSCVFHQYIAGDSQHLVGKRWNRFWSQKCQQISFASKLQFCDESIFFKNGFLNLIMFHCNRLLIINSNTTLPWWLWVRPLQQWHQFSCHISLILVILSKANWLPSLDGGQHLLVNIFNIFYNFRANIYLTTFLRGKRLQ